MKYLTTTGKIVSGPSPCQVLEALKDSSPYYTGLSLEMYKSSLQRQMLLFYGEYIDDRDPELIVEQLEAAGVLLRLE
ncbi:hypothetical protein [Telluribacter humicola]|uniref:hypothetical protein n=1 Tax=Telluribacter humicola TaxID=1720261 RepID=UPI001A9601ED|nr:hypothetical protein [Telluribacter humicola]